MSEIKLLDCTLRDGGYVNDWKFGHDHLVNVFERVVDAGVDVIEVGFLDDRRPFDMDRSIMPDTDSVSKIYGDLDRKNTMVVGMIDYGTCSLDHIKPCSESFLDGIRVIFKKGKREEAMAFCRAVKEKGYKVFSQLVSVTSYSDEEMMDLVRLANEVEPYAVSIVDTYGLMHQNDLMHYFDLLNENLLPGIRLGYHAHNNFQMGYANCIAFLERPIDRPRLVDGSLYGMGKSAGNAPLELLAMHMNHKLGKNYQLSQILEAIDTSISDFYTSATWGYNMFYFLAASNDCHPTYVQYLMEKHTLSIRSVNEILSRLEGEKKLLVDLNYLEKLYREYQKKEVNDRADFARVKKEWVGRPLLLLGPGSTVRTEKKRIRQYVEEKSPVIISVNYLPEDFKIDYLFLTNSKRYLQLSSRLARTKQAIVATSNVTPTCPGAFSCVLNFSSLIDPDCEFVDNSFLMLLKVLMHLGVGEVAAAGFDGYAPRKNNFVNRQMSYDFLKGKENTINEYTSSFLKKIRPVLSVHFLTETLYCEPNA